MFIFTKEIKWYPVVLISIFLPGFSSKIHLGPFRLYEEEQVYETSTPVYSQPTAPSFLPSSSTSEPNLSLFMIFKEYFLPVFYFFSLLISTSFFLHRLCRTFNLQFKYRRFRFIRRSAAEQSDIRQRNMIIEMDPLSITSHRSENFVPNEHFYDAKETIV